MVSDLIQMNKVHPRVRSEVLEQRMCLDAEVHL